MKKIVSKMLSVLTVLFMVSCSTDVDKDLGKEPVVSSTNTAERMSSGVVLENNYIEAENANNPLDYYGIIHNDVLEKVMSREFTNVKSAVDYSLEVLEEDFGRRGIDLGEPISFEEVESIVADRDDFYLNITNHYTNNDTKVNEKMNEFFTMLKEYSNGQDTTYSGIKLKIVDFESGVLASTDLSITQKDKILVSTSVARYSLYFWSQRYENMSPDKKRKRRWWHWLIVAGADAAGASAGGISGAIQASVAATKILDWLDEQYVN